MPLKIKFILGIITGILIVTLTLPYSTYAFCSQDATQMNEFPQIISVVLSPGTMAGSWQLTCYDCGSGVTRCACGKVYYKTTGMRFFTQYSSPFKVPAKGTVTYYGVETQLDSGGPVCGTTRQEIVDPTSYSAGNGS